MEPTRKSRKKRQRFDEQELHSAGDSNSCSASNGGRTDKPLEGDNPDAKRRRRMFVRMDTLLTNSTGTDRKNGHTTRRQDDQILRRKRDTRPLVTEQSASLAKDNRKHMRPASSQRCEEQVTDKPLPRDDVQRLHSCEVCGKSLPRRSYLKRHRLTHSREKPFLCNVCGKAFRLKKSLRTTNEYTRGRNRMLAMCAEMHLRHHRALVDINRYTRERNGMFAVSVGRPLRRH